MLALPFFLKEKTIDILRLLLEESTQLGKNITPILDKLLILNDGFLKYYEQVQIDDRNTIVKYLEKFTIKAGSIREEDMITQLICNLIGQLKEKQQPTVLIIDDLDRIDPEHIFRLLNVFAAHFDLKRNSNKFDFDKKIFVCDIENVRNIFHSKYGLDTDFSGYIDKFYSTEIFNFDNTEMIENAITQILKSIKLDDKFEKVSNLYKQDLVLNDNIHLVLRTMVKVNAINLRSLVKLFGITYPILELTVSISPSQKKSNFLFQGILLIDFLKFILGDVTRLKRAVKKCADSKYAKVSKEEGLVKFLEVLLPTIDIQFAMTSPEKQNKSYVNNNANTEYTISGGINGRIPFKATINEINYKNNQMYQVVEVNYFDYLFTAIEVLQSHNYLPQ